MIDEGRAPHGARGLKYRLRRLAWFDTVVPRMGHVD